LGGGVVRLLGPIFFFELLRGSRKRIHLKRTFFLAFLLFALTYVWAMPREAANVNQVHEQAQLAETLFVVFFSVMLVVVILFTPVTVASAIAEEKERHTLEFILATDLLSREIILGKLAGRMTNICLYLLAGIPVLGLLQVMGGIDPTLLFAAFAVVMLLLFSIAALSILQSTLLRRARDAIVTTYLAMIAYTALTVPLAYLEPNTWQATFHFAGWTVTGDELLAAPAAGNLINAAMQLRAALQKDIDLTTILPQLLQEFGIFHCSFIVLCLGWAMYRLRPVGVQQSASETPGRFRRKPRRNPAVGNFPMLWKELFADPGPRLHWTLRVLGALIILAGFVPAAIILWEHHNLLLADHSSYSTGFDWQMLSNEMNTWVQEMTGLVGTLMWLTVAIRSAGTISGERARHTLEDLLTTPMSLGEILWGKWAGALVSVRRFCLWLGLVLFIGLCTGGLYPLAVILVPLVWLAVAGMLAAVGLWFSTVCRTTQRATALTLLVTFLLLGGHWLLSMLCCFGPFTPMPDDMTSDPLRSLYGGFTPVLILAMSAYNASDKQVTMHEDKMLIFDIGAMFCLIACLLSTPIILNRVRRRLAVQCNRIPRSNPADVEEVDYRPGM
jgi:ABC-type Na+ efflux pump permease subunit